MQTCKQLYPEFSLGKVLGIVLRVEALTDLDLHHSFNHFPECTNICSMYNVAFSDFGIM